ncbi:hypothetical protein VPH219E481_0016 [Vibrio phage 219E48-1]|nr:hypothetical protein PODOV021v1_p0003 [Vibrio phage 219E41.2]QZI91039.1 hypothetical protein PODOV032v1_p0034 [Vibrio phage 219E41.1]QZI91144.1 hypothetical protein PODOV060v1_p0050 [Vibrio phage 234P8]QZI91563.1 hypothetical protein PODOV087v1_p0058 [Vibrio phage 431E45.1]QZI91653.1 hypothetical protein PODOV086v1_p0069 [Vibrio phage 431E46.1]QZI91686.1 hypothetical protein PODOV088v1_p0025 [Vibrio phage 431E48.2]
MSWFNSLMDTGTQVFSWMEENPTATSFIGGAAVGALSYLEAKEDRDFQRELRDEEREYRSTFGGASTTDAGKEAPTLSSLGEGIVTGGKLTEGNIAKLSDTF